MRDIDGLYAMARLNHQGLALVAAGIPDHQALLGWVAEGELREGQDKVDAVCVDAAANVPEFYKGVAGLVLRVSAGRTASSIWPPAVALYCSYCPLSVRHFHTQGPVCRSSLGTGVEAG